MIARMNKKDKDAELRCLIPVESITSPLPLERWFESDTPLELEIGCGNGRFLAARAGKNPDVGYLGIERMLPRVKKLNRKAVNHNLQNIRVLRLEAFYTFYYLLPRHRLRAVYVFFPDPWPKKHHHPNRLLKPEFLDALWARIEIGGEIQIATDDAPYYQFIRQTFDADKRFEAIAPMERTEDEQTDFEMLFRGKGCAVHACAYRTVPAPEPPLEPLKVPPSRYPRPGTESETESTDEI